MIRQSSNHSDAMRMLAEQPTEARKRAFAHGYNNAHGIACHISLRLGQRVEAHGEDVVVDEENFRDVLISMAVDAEENSRCFSPWEQVASEINSSIEDPTELWESYDAGVFAAIEHDAESAEVPDAYSN